MKVHFLGTRGSYPVSDLHSSFYGGNTPCIKVVSGDNCLILDAGTGILNQNQLATSEQKVYHILLSHLHMDHIQGLGFFQPIFSSESEVHIWGPSGLGESLYERLGRFLSPPIFPVSIRDFSCKMYLHEISAGEYEVAGFNVTSAFVSHPGATFGYRVTDGKSTLTYIPDHEPIIGKLELLEDPNWLSGYDLAKNSDLLIHDAQYNIEEYWQKVGWGHSSINIACAFAQKTGAKRLVLFHHDPSHNDTTLKEIYTAFQDNSNYDFPIEMAVEGQTIDF